jgi:cystathionine beta-lyase family protein involved in aluminum resistance
MNAILRDAYHITDPVYNYVKACEDKLQGLFLEHQRIREYNQLKVIRAFQENRLASYDFHSSSGYGYGEGGREKVDRIFAKVFGAQDALVRPGIASGTHALTLALQGILLPGDEMLCITGLPYDTMQKNHRLEGKCSALFTRIPDLLCADRSGKRSPRSFLCAGENHPKHQADLLAAIHRVYRQGYPVD